MTQPCVERTLSHSEHLTVASDKSSRILRKRRQERGGSHASTIATSTCVSRNGTFRPKSRDASSQASAASRMPLIASSRVLPSLKHPGKAGIEAHHTPSSSTCRTTFQGFRACATMPDSIGSIKRLKLRGLEAPAPGTPQKRKEPSLSRWLFRRRGTRTVGPPRRVSGRLLRPGAKGAGGSAPTGAAAGRECLPSQLEIHRHAAAEDVRVAVGQRVLVIRTDRRVRRQLPPGTHAEPDHRRA